MEAKWIWIDTKRTEEPVMVYFKKEVYISEIKKISKINISADSRYNLYINDKRVNSGPCKSPFGVRYYDTVDIAPYLKVGLNSIFVKVISYPKDPLKALSFSQGPISVMTEGIGGLIVEETETEYGFNTDETYLCAKVNGYGFERYKYAGYVGFSENIDAIKLEELNYINANIIKEKQNSNQYGLCSFWQLEKRPVPLMFEKECNFSRINRSKNTISLDAGFYVFAYPKVKINGIKDGVVRITYAEGYGNINENGQYIKGVRDNPEGQVIHGETDVYLTKEGLQEYITFYPRAFRVIMIEFSEGVAIEDISYIETGYPLDVSAEFNTGNKVFDDMWQVSVRTLKLCMYETYVDCPYYEQMQYLMDTYLEAYYTLCISNDSSLVKKAIKDFAYSQLGNGLLPCNAPAAFIQVIPGFSIYWILLLDLYFMYESDIEFIKQHLGTMDKIIQYFVQHVNKDGLLGNLGYWQFFDWAKSWERGCPAKENEINVLYNMLFVLGLRTAASINKECGRIDTSNEYINIADSISIAIRKYGYDNGTGLFCDVVGGRPDSVHAQVFAVVASIVNEEEKKPLIERMIKRYSSLNPMSYAMSFFLCRALEETNMYKEVHKTAKVWYIYEDLLKLNMTTWPEDFVQQRSDCHGWSALPLSEFTRCYLGVRPLGYGFSKVGIYINDSPFDKYDGVVPVKDKNIFISVDNSVIRVRLPRGLNYELKDLRENTYNTQYIVEEY